MTSLWVWSIADATQSLSREKRRVNQISCNINLYAHYVKNLQSVFKISQYMCKNLYLMRTTRLGNFTSKAFRYIKLRGLRRISSQLEY